ncbi:hypothetical protein PIB30_065529 [Stylosanthes scabra]|uniref:Uncharacterized protein n=1 Tax=Stylosanthes scabra TaxID=79078 RepID=A0ABU6RM98_9FABA|nr:hypothetical protein [Stylosanthes scabra]
MPLMNGAMILAQSKDMVFGSSAEVLNFSLEFLCITFKFEAENVVQAAEEATAYDAGKFPNGVNTRDNGAWAPVGGKLKACPTSMLLNVEKMGWDEMQNECDVGKDEVHGNAADSSFPVREDFNLGPPSETTSVTCNALFGLGVPDLVYAGVAALVFSPNKLPEVGRSIGKTVKSFEQA